MAIAILRQAAGAIAETVYDMVARCELAAQPFPLIGSGSIATRSTIYWEHLCAAVRAFAPHCRPMRSTLPPVAGVALAGLRHLPAADLPAAEARLLAEVGMGEARTTKPGDMVRGGNTQASG